MSCSRIMNIQPRAFCAAVIAVTCIACSTVQAQFFRNPGVGGVKIDTDGVVSNPQVGELKQLHDAWQNGLQPVPADLQKWAELRFVSLKQLESERVKRESYIGPCLPAGGVCGELPAAHTFNPR